MNARIDDIREAMEQRSTEELVSILRNRDEEEWQPVVFDVVASILTARGVSAAEVAAREPEGDDVVEDQTLATVGYFFNPLEAHAARQTLENSGITAWVADENLGLGQGMRLQVRVEDEATALGVLEAGPRPLPDVEPAEGSVLFMSGAQAETAILTARTEDPATAVRVIRGRKCGTVRDLHNEVAAALQFPDDYGENWDAMRECMFDLSWMPATGYLVVVLDVGSVLPPDDDGLRAFLGIFADATRAWANPDPERELPGRRATFRVVIAGDDASISRASAALGV